MSFSAIVASSQFMLPNQRDYRALPPVRKGGQSLKLNLSFLMFE